MTGHLLIRRAADADAPCINSLLSEWFEWKPAAGRLRSVRRAIRNRELLVAENSGKLIGFIHFIKHEDIIDGGPNTFITAFYVSRGHRRKGIGTRLLNKSIVESFRMGALGVETSTIHRLAKKLYEKNHFKQTIGDIGEVLLELDIPEYLKKRKRF